MTNPTPPPRELIDEQVGRALAEDVGDGDGDGDGDVTAGLIDPREKARARILCRRAAVVCGAPWVEATLARVDPSTGIEWFVADGDTAGDGAVVAELHGPARGILTAERTALNFLQTLSATATRTRRYVDAVSDYKVRLLDTRKTIPGLRAAQKYAVRCGGGDNHRMGLYDAFLIKENHIRAAGGIAAAVHRAREQRGVTVEVEVENPEQLKEAIAAGPDRILLDNFDRAALAAAVAETAGRVPLEASGNITLANIAAVAATGVDFISLGTLTKDIEAADFSLLFA